MPPAVLSLSSAVRRLRLACDRGTAAVLVVGAFAAVLLVSNLNDRDLWPSHEARAAQDAAGFLETGHWGLLRHFDGTPECQKPPLYYWSVAALARLNGGQVDAWPVRLPAALAGLALCVAVTVFC